MVGNELGCACPRAPLTPHPSLNGTRPAVRYMHMFTQRKKTFGKPKKAKAAKPDGKVSNRMHARKRTLPCAAPAPPARPPVRLSIKVAVSVRVLFARHGKGAS